MRSPSLSTPPSYCCFASFSLGVSHILCLVFALSRWICFYHFHFRLTTVMLPLYLSVPSLQLACPMSVSRHAIPLRIHPGFGSFDSSLCLSLLPLPFLSFLTDQPAARQAAVGRFAICPERNADCRLVLPPIFLLLIF